jgi:hypothetical protein
MRHRFIIAVVLIAGISLVQSRFHLGPWAASSELSETSAAPEQIENAFHNHTSGVMVTAEASVDRILADDTTGDRHQRFIVRLPSGITVLVAHNIDVAPRIPGVATGGTVKLHGQYEWSDKGGTVHWTHRDHRGSHEAGWIEFKGIRYE